MYVCCYSQSFLIRTELDENDWLRGGSIVVDAAKDVLVLSFCLVAIPSLMY